MHQNAAQVVIIGAGPVGLGLAIELGLRGIRCIVVERRLSPQHIPKGQNLTQRTMEHFHFWGAEKELRGARTIPREYGMGGLTAYGALLSDYAYDWLQRALVRPYYFTDNERLPQFATEAVLRRRAAEFTSVKMLFGWTTVEIDQGENGVEVIAEHGDEGRITLRGAYLVGCDGARSIVREAGGITQSPITTAAWFAGLPFESAPRVARALSWKILLQHSRSGARGLLEVLRPRLPR